MEQNQKVWIRGVLGRGYEVINELIKLGGNNHGLCGEILDDIYYIGPDNSIEYIRDDIKRAKEIMAEYKEIKLDDSPSITASQDYGLNVSKNLSTFAKTCINLPEGSSVNICNENGKVMIIVDSKQVKEEEPQLKKGDIVLLELQAPDTELYKHVSIIKGVESENYREGDLTIYASLCCTTYNCILAEAKEMTISKYNIKSIRYATEDEIAEFNKEFAEQKKLKWNAEEFKFDPIRWRAKEGNDFWFLNNYEHVVKATDCRDRTANMHFDFGNYFQTEELAKQASGKIKVLLSKL